MITLAYRVAGDPADPAVVLLHGLGENAASWHDVQQALAGRHRVYALDQRGHGDSPDPGAYSFAAMRDDVLGFLDAHGISRAVLIGHSLGAIVAALVAQAAPGRVTHLVLEDAAPPRPGDLSRPPLPDGSPLVNAVRAQLHDPDPAWFAATATITAPTLIIGGADSPIPAEMLRAAADRIPDATLVTLPAGHDVHRDRPGDFLAAVTRWLPGSR